MKAIHKTLLYGALCIAGMCVAPGETSGQGTMYPSRARPARAVTSGYRYQQTDPRHFESPWEIRYSNLSRRIPSARRSITGPVGSANIYSRGLGRFPVRAW